MTKTKRVLLSLAIAGAFVFTADQMFDLGQHDQAQKDRAQVVEWVKSATFPTVQVADGEAVAIIEGGVCVPGVSQLPSAYRIQVISPFSAPCYAAGGPLKDSAALRQVMKELGK